MALNSKNLPKTGGSKQPVLEAGNYLGRLVQVIDLGMQKRRPFKGQEKDPCYTIRLTYELPTEFCVDEDGNPDETKPRWIGEEMPFFPLSSERAKCTKRYNAFDSTHEFEGDWAELVGMPCTITVVNSYSKKTDREYANVGAVTPPMKGVEVPPLINEPTVFDMDSPDLEVFETLPDWVKEKILDGLEFKGSKLDRLLSGETISDDPLDEIDEMPF